jgi:hypothetical protein
MQYTWVNWNDPIFIWKGPEDFIWSQAKRPVKAGLPGGDFFWGLPREDRAPKKRVDPTFNLTVRVNGLTHHYKGTKQTKPRITVDQVQKSLRNTEKEVIVKVDIKK